MFVGEMKQSFQIKKKNTNKTCNKQVAKKKQVSLLKV